MCAASSVSLYSKWFGLYDGCHYKISLIMYFFFARHVVPKAHCLNIISLNRTDSLFNVRVHRVDSLSIDGEILTRDANSPYGIRLKGGEYSRKGELSRNCDKSIWPLVHTNGGVHQQEEVVNLS